MAARVGKIARLPQHIREDLNKRIRGGELGPKILPWLNGLPETQAVLAEFFNNTPINAQNLSDWRNGGFAEWEERQDTRYQRLERVREMSAASVKLAQANGGNLSEGAAAILGGRILEVLEELEELSAQPAADDDDGSRIAALSGAIESMTLAVSRLRKGDHDLAVLRQNDERLRQKESELDLARERFQRDTCELFIKWYADKRATEIVAGPLSNESKLQEMGKLMFGELWDKAKQPAQ